MPSSRKKGLQSINFSLTFGHLSTLSFLGLHKVLQSGGTLPLIYLPKEKYHRGTKSNYSKLVVRALSLRHTPTPQYFSLTQSEMLVISGFERAVGQVWKLSQPEEHNSYVGKLLGVHASGEWSQRHRWMEM